MTISTWCHWFVRLQHFRSGRRRTAKKRSRFCKPSFESLETRLVPSTFYVATNGSDTRNSGLDAAHPFATIQHAADLATHPGDTVHVAPGNYAGFDAEYSGSAGNPITFIADNIPASNQFVNITSFDPVRKNCGIVIQNSFGSVPVSYVTVNGFNVSNLVASGNNAGIYTGGTASTPGGPNSHNDHITIENCVCNGDGMWGIFTAFTDHLDIVDNVCSNTVVQHGIYVSNSSQAPIIQGNIVFGNHDCGIQINADGTEGDVGITSGALIEDNIVCNNGTGGGAALNFDGVQNSVISNNVLYGNHAGGITLYHYDGSAGSTNNVVVNNTVIMASDGRWDININSQSTGNVLFNNILLNANPAHGSIEVTPDSMAGFVSDYNVVSGNASDFTNDTSNYSLAAWRTATGQDSHSFATTAAALFVNPAGNDYQLLSSGPAIDAGTAGLAGFSTPVADLGSNGTSYDIGANQSPATTPPTGPSVVKAAAAGPATVDGTTTKLSVLGADPAGQGKLTYTWTATSVPSGATNPSFSVNGTNGARKTVVTFHAAGSYTFLVTITDPSGLTATSSVNVTVKQTLNSIVVTPNTATVQENKSLQLTAKGYDQFGNLLVQQPDFTWKVLSGPGTIKSKTGVFTAGSTTGTAQIQVASRGVKATATIAVGTSSPPPS